MSYLWQRIGVLLTMTKEFTEKHNFVYGMADPQAYIDMLIDAGMKELIIKYPAYGNSYLDTDKLNLAFWKKRLTNEIQEYKKCLTPQERKRKIVNLFNLVWMAYYFELVGDNA